MLDKMAAPFGRTAFPIGGRHGAMAFALWLALSGAFRFMPPSTANDDIDLGLIGRFLEVATDGHNPLDTRYKTMMDLVNQTIIFHYEYDPDTHPSLQQIAIHLSDMLCRNPKVSPLLIEGLVVRYVLEQANGTDAIFEVDKRCAKS